MAAVIEEECTGNGALAVMQALPKPDACLIPEPGPGHPALYTAEVGVVWAWVTVTGRPTHVREMQAGVNAIEAAYVGGEAFPRLRDGDESRRAPASRLRRGQPPDQRQFRHDRGRRVEQLGADARAHRHARRRDAGLFLPPGEGRYRAPGRRGRARRGAARREARGRVQGVHGGWRDLPRRAADRAGGERRCTAKSPARRCATTTRPASPMRASTRSTRARRRPATAPDGDAIHGIDESVSLATMQDVIRVYALTIAGWCGVEKVTA